METQITRRNALGRIGGSALAGTALASLAQQISAAESDAGLKGKVNHSVCRWCYNKIELEDLCKASKEMGIQSVELLKIEDFPVLKKHGLSCAMVSGVPGGIEVGLNRAENHAKIAKYMEEAIPMVANAGFPNIICFSGNRKGMDDAQGIENCAAGIKQFIAVAEKHKVNVCMELLNSKVNHKDYMCDHTAWGVELCKRVGSDRFKLLYDIYHMQIMEGDLIATIKSSHQYIGHYHTGGVPGRAEIDETQEINYPAVMKAILATGYKGFVAQEFIPKRSDALASLKQGVQICDV
jgi:hydroxypyruvate isomerase